MSWYNQWAPIIASAGNSPENIVQTLVGVLGGCKPMMTDQPVTIDYPNGTALNVHGNTFVSGRLAVGPGLDLGPSGGNTGLGGNGDQPIFQVRGSDGTQQFVVWPDGIEIKGPIHIATDNLIANGSAETNGGVDDAGPTPTSWTAASGTWGVRNNTHDPRPQHGDWYFSALTSAGTVELYQDVDLTAYAAYIDQGTQRAEFIGYTASFNQAPPDSARIVVEYRDTVPAVLASYDTGNTTNTSAFVRYSNQQVLPVGTRTARIRLISIRNTGTNNDGYYDNLQLRLIGPGA